MESFEPTSQGPNIPSENPYPAWNKKMARMEESGAKKIHLYATGEEDEFGRPIYQDKTGRLYVDINLGKKTPDIYTITPDGEPLSRLKNYEIIKKFESERTFPNALCPNCKNSNEKEISRYPDGRARCNVCHWRNYDDNSPNVILDSNIAKNKEQKPTIIRIKEEVFEELKKHHFRLLGNTPNDYMEYYANGVATVSINFENEKKQVQIERYYDSEYWNDMPGYQVVKKYPIPETYDPRIVKKIVEICLKLKNHIEDNIAILGIPDDPWNITENKARRKTIIKENEHDDTITKVKKEVFSVLKKHGFRLKGDAPQDYMEWYSMGFATINVGFSYRDYCVHLERYYDNEKVDNMPGKHINNKFPIPEKYDPSLAKNIINHVLKLQKNVRGDESLFGGNIGDEELPEPETLFTEVKWPCSHCGKNSKLQVEFKTPSDYIVCSECEHCGKEIKDLHLDRKIYTEVINCYSTKNILKS